MKKILIPLVLILGMALESYSQVSCTQKLSEAEDLYDAGRLYEVTKKINEGNCLSSGKDGFTKEEKIKAYRLLALVYLFMDNEPDAEDAVVNLLLVDPEHPENDPNDPAELKYLFAKYRSKPIFRIGTFIGGNATGIHSMKTYAVFNTSSNDFDSVGSPISKQYSSKMGFSAGIGIEYMLVKNLEILLRATYASNVYEVNYNLISNGSYEATNAFEVLLTESQQWLRTPLALRYNIPIGTVTPYVMGGVSFDWLLSAKMTGNRGGLGTKFVTDLDLVDLKMRNRTNWSYLGGVGMKVNFKRTDSFFIEATYSVGAQNFVNSANRYASDQLNYNMGHIDDDMAINSLAVKVGYIKSFYNPKKYSDKKLQKVNQKRAKK
ncbi:outer membrane beta-barrel protein [Reichenbachiella agarivorans]|uniref:Outer membrane beta-barrel protein n=1 Tax=Reichenbachiella agarivorans TaxID=2979464 RepID=A0ABY6CNB9_9BACT|nr:outer membrane beta-barrel protein [Reichenbachiella agarivorans]UXP32001.1 outer membrane beta-barrel protein [Reichenbachiella agarivorans]